MTPYPTRWNLDLITVDPAAWQADTAAFADAWRDRMIEVAADPAILADALNAYEHLQRRHGYGGGEWYRASLAQESDSSDTATRAAYATATNAAVEAQNRIQFFPLALARMTPAQQAAALAYPALQRFRHVLETAFAEGVHTLSDAEEAYGAKLASPAYERWVDMVANALSAEEVETLGEDGQRTRATLPTVMSLLNSVQAPVRDEAARHVHDVCRRYAPMATDELNAILQYKRVQDDLRRFARPDAARHLADDIPSSVVDTVIGAVHDQNGLAHRLYRLKARLLGKSTLAYHERNVPLGDLPNRYSYQDSLALVTDVFATLHPDLGAIVTRLASNGQIDVDSRPGKRGGAFCAHHALAQPTFILLNHTGQLQDVLTLAHELGHAVHNELMRQRQHGLTFDTPLSLAEVASTFFEDFVLRRLSQTLQRPEERLALLVRALGDDVSTVFRQAACYRFETALHAAFRRDNYLSQDAINTLFAEHMAAYMGPAVEASPGSERWWVYWSHIRTFFYVSSYVSGLLLAKALQRQVTADPTTIDGVMAILSAGSSAAPAQLLAGAGLDLAGPDVWQQGLSGIATALAEAERLADEIGTP